MFNSHFISSVTNLMQTDVISCLKKFLYVITGYLVLKLDSSMCHCALVILSNGVIFERLGYLESYYEMNEIIKSLSLRAKKKKHSHQN